ncbi:FAD-dependent oxidoreductase [Paenibacillus sp. JJ-223]|uniref:FAD-dependent oxidoreductase n=1 Tax=Paenibacillus sp. JJ-223 TaxID=2905647 RepID=UPI001F3CD9F1|nr:FAD-dependent oxidoreductase [Paenibacillus sp. JJ-223]CAH1205384.1 putative pyridine nucleotide-disulfide oxidoreductase RclA [Paenibacillus sp. JJ-223]
MTRKTFDALIIGFGKGGKTLAPFLAEQGWKVGVVEKSPSMYGGTCINIGCIPTKALAYQAHLASREEGNDQQTRQAKYAHAMQEKNELVSLLRDKNFNQLNNHPNITVLTGTASFHSQHEVRVETESDTIMVEAKQIFINTGAKPNIPDLPGIHGPRVYTSTEMLDLAKLPSRLTIIGGGYIGLEFASIYAGFGSQVTVLESGKVFLPREDREIAEEVKNVLEQKGIRFRLQTNVTNIESQGEAARLLLSGPDGEEEWLADAVLVAAGRRANTDGLNLAAAGVEVTERGFIRVDETLRTTVPHIWAMGDVNGGPQFTYISLDDSRIVKNQMFGDKTRTTVDRRFVPYSVFIDPPLAHVGYTEQEAVKRGHAVKTAKLPLTASTRARQLQQTDGLMKAVVDAASDRLLGFTMFGAESSEVVNIVSVFMQSEQPFTVLRDTIFTHPSMAETINDLLGAIQ